MTANMSQLVKLILVGLLLWGGVVTAVSAVPLVNITKVVVDSPPYCIGENVTWKVTVVNNESDIEQINVTDSVTSGFIVSAISDDSGDTITIASGGSSLMWNITNFDEKENATLTLKTNLTSPGIQENNATITTAIPDDDTSDNNYTETIIFERCIGGEGSFSIRPRSINLNAKGVITVSFTIGERAKKGDIEYANLKCNNATAQRVSYSMKDGGTLSAKFRRVELDGPDELDEGASYCINCTGNVTVNGTPYQVEGSGCGQVFKAGEDNIIVKMIKKLFGMGDDDEEADDSTEGTGLAIPTLNLDNFKNLGQQKKAIRQGSGEVEPEDGIEAPPLTHPTPQPGKENKGEKGIKGGNGDSNNDIEDDVEEELESSQGRGKGQEK